MKKCLIAYSVNNWVADPFSKGAYSYSSPDSAAAKKILLSDVGGILFFAGEAFGKSNGTVESALESGKEAAERVLRI